MTLRGSPCKCTYWGLAKGGQKGVSLICSDLKGGQKGVSLICSDLIGANRKKSEIGNRSKSEQIGTKRGIPENKERKSEQIGTKRGIPENKELKSEQIGRKGGNRNKSG